MIRLPNIPGLQGTALNEPTVNPRAAAAPAQALGAVANAIAGVSEKFHDTALQIQKLENGRLISAKRSELAQGYADLQLELEQDPDPASRMKRMDAFLANSKNQMDGDDLPPAVRAELLAHHDGFATNARIAQGRDSAQLAVQRAKLQFENEYGSGLTSGDPETVRGSIQTAVASGLLLPEQGVKLQRDADLALKTKSLQKEIIGDPLGWVERNPADRAPEGFDPMKWQEMHNFAQSLGRKQMAEDMGAIEDGMVTGHITTDAQIDELGMELPPRVREELKISRAKREFALTNQAEKARLQSPEYQAEVVGKVSALLADYEPVADGWDVRLVQMNSLINTLPEGNAYATELKRRIGEVAKGKVAEVKSHAEAGQVAIDEAYKAGRFGTVPEAMRTDRAIADGFLVDRDKLKALGFSKAQWDEIFKAKTDAEREKLFIAGWKTREGENTADAYTNATADAILGKSTTITPPGLDEAKIGAERAYGTAKQKFAEWMKLNPKATAKEIDDQVFQFAGEEARKKLQSGVLDPKPSRETSMNLPKALVPLRTAFVDEGNKHGIDPRFLAAISMHETANGTSSAFQNKNNAMGVSNSSGPIAFDDSKDSIARMARLFASPKGPYRNAKTLAEIAKVYAPIGAENDPGGLNSGWAAGVTRYLRQLGGDPNSIFL